MQKPLISLIVTILILAFSAQSVYACGLHEKKGSEKVTKEIAEV